MHITIINDCKDQNVAGRQLVRAQTLFNAPATFVGVQNDLEAAGNLVDVLDAARTATHTVLVNVAPRAAKSWWLTAEFPKHTNGTPFCFFKAGTGTVLSSVDGYTLSLIKKLGLTDSVNVIDYAGAVDLLVKESIISTDEVEDVLKTQFRSFNFLPRVALLLSRGSTVPSTTLPLSHIPDAPRGSWLVDNFGNIKTTVTNRETAGATSINIFDRDIPLFPRLSDIPDGTLGAAVGSSGYGTERFVEVFIQGGSAAQSLLSA